MCSWCARHKVRRRLFTPLETLEHAQPRDWIKVFKDRNVIKQAELVVCAASVPAPEWSWSFPPHSRWESVSPAGGPSPRWCVCTLWGPRCSPLSELSPASYWRQLTPWWPGGLQNLEEQREKSSITQLSVSKSTPAGKCCAVNKTCEGILALNYG